MNIHYQKRFLKDLAKIPSKTRSKIERFVFEELPHAQNLAGIGKVEKMTGYDLFYKVTFGSYRVGLRLAENSVVCERVMHRRDIYRFFPPM